MHASLKVNYMYLEKLLGDDTGITYGRPSAGSCVRFWHHYLATI